MTQFDAKWKIPPTWLMFLLVTVLLLGLFFRFTHLDKKIYWGDESHTSLWLSGHTSLDVMEAVLDGRIFTIDELHRFQHLNPDKGFNDTINALATEYPLHPPFYYGALRLWAQGFGDSVATIRRFSAIASLLVFPAVYWLCWELFQSSQVGWITVALMAVSPYQILYAQEAREYGLWTVTVLLSSAALLRAIRTQTLLSWGIYAVALALSFYTFVFSFLVAIGQGIYVVATQGLRGRRVVGAYLLASLAGVLLFAPWLLLIIEFSRTHQEKWLNQALSLPEIAKRWVGVISRTILDVGIDSSDAPSRFMPLIPLILIILLLIGYAFYVLCRTTPIQVWLFVVLLTLTTPLVLTLRDLKIGGILSTIPRYLFPCFIGIQLAVAYLLATKLMLTQRWQQKVWQFVLVAVLTSGVVSAAISAEATIWWNKGSSSTKQGLESARIVDQATQPLLIMNASEWQVMTLSYMLDSKVRLERVSEPIVLTIPSNFSDVFVFNPSDTLKAKLTQEKYRLEPVYEPGWLWRIQH